MDRPPIWRRIQVPDYYTFWDLHASIQNAMGWLDLHLHAFKIMNPKKRIEEEIGIGYRLQSSERLIHVVLENV